jgi:hypothetical protein
MIGGAPAKMCNDDLAMLPISIANHDASTAVLLSTMTTGAMTSCTRWYDTPPITAALTWKILQKRG